MISKLLLCVLLIMGHPLIIETIDLERRMCSFNIDIINSPNSLIVSDDVTATWLDVMKCTILDGDFTIAMTRKSNKSFPVFPKIIEITGFLLIYSVPGLKSVEEIFPNLRVIGGNSLISKKSLLIYQNSDLKYIGLNKLTIIRNGGIRITENPKLCFSRYINWESILIGNIKGIYVDQTSMAFFDEDEQFQSCQDMNGCIVKDSKMCEKVNGILSCWNSTTCQPYCPYHKPHNNVIGPGCSPDGEMCHASCIGGCFATNDPSLCYACKNFEMNGLCVDECPSDMFVYKSHRCITEKECHNLLPKTEKSRSQKVLWKAFQGKCHHQCSDGFQEDSENPRICVECDGFCPKVCLGILVDSVNKALKFTNCNIIDGNLTIILQTTGRSGEKLRRAFENIREIKGYLLIHYSPILTSLNMFQSLQKIHGENLINGRYALAIFEMENLKQLFKNEIEKNLIIKNGLISFQNNPKLCFEKIMKFVKNVGMENNITDNDISKYGNGEKAICDEYELHVNAKTITSIFFVLSWKKIDRAIIDQQHFLGYIIYYKKVDKIDHKIDIDEDRCVCGGAWNIKFVQNNQEDDNEMITEWIADISANSIYAYYVKGQIIHHSNAKNIISKVGFVTTAFWRSSLPLLKRYKSISPEHILLEWDPPEKENGVITYYSVKWNFVRKENGASQDPCKPFPKLPTLSTLHSSGNSQNSYFFKDQTFKEKFEDQSNFNRLLLKRILSPAMFENFSFKRNRRNIPEINLTSLNATNHIAGEINVTSTKYIITGLKFFTLYSIQIIACQDEKVKYNYCSKPTNHFVRTLSIPENDVIDSKTIKARKYIVDGKNQEDSRIINWTIPDNPNEEVLGFRYELWREDKTLSTDQCIKKDDFQKNDGILIKELSNGFYTLKIRTISSAGISEKVVVENLFEVYVPGWLTWDKIIFICLGLAMIVAVIVWFGWRHYKQYLEKKVQQYLTISANSEYPHQLKIYKKDEWELKREDLRIFDEIGRGTFGKVFHGDAKNIVSKCGTKFGKCAIKIIPECASHSERMHFLLEASVMKQFNSAFIVKLYGVVSEGIPAFLVMELMEKGNLRDFLRAHRPNSEENLTNASMPSKLSYFKWAFQIADGMAYLESQKFVHRDLAARNCMVSNDETVKIGDFGMARDIYYHEYYKPLGCRLLPIRWLAPENLKDGKFTVKSDVWSYGIVLYEMVTLGQQPYAGLRNDQVFEYIERKRKIINCPKFWYFLMQKCWIYDPRNRPWFYQILFHLKDAIEKYFKNSTEENSKIFQNSFATKNFENIEKTNYNFSINENEEIRKHTLLEELDKITEFEGDSNNFNKIDEISTFMNDNGDENNILLDND